MLGRTRFNFYGSYGFSSFLLQSPNIRNVDDIDAIDDIDEMEYNHDDIHRAQKCLDEVSYLAGRWGFNALWLAHDTNSNKSSSLLDARRLS